MKENLMLLSFLFIGCSQKDKVIHDIIKASNEPKTTFVDAVRETQEIMLDSSELLVVVPNDKFDMLDYSWVDDANEDFSISFSGDALSISGNEIVTAKIYVRLETSITIMDEGKHCDLDNWIHGYTSWSQAKLRENYDIATLGYANYDNPYLNYKSELPFPEINMDELREEVEKNCGDFWKNHIQNCNTIYDYPCGVGINAYIFKVKYKLGIGAEKTAYFRINVAMGC